MYKLPDVTKPKKAPPTKQKPPTIKEIDDAQPFKPGQQVPPVDLSRLTYEELNIHERGVKRIDPTVGVYIKPKKAVMYDIQNRSKLPFGKLYELTQDGHRMALLRSKHYEDMLNIEARKVNYNLTSGKKIYRLLEQKGFRHENMTYNKAMEIIKSNDKLKSKFGDLTKTEFEIANKIREIFNKAGREFGIPAEEMILDYVHRMRKDGIATWEQAIREYKLPEEYKWAAEEQRTGYLSPHEENIFTVVRTYIQRGAKKKYLAPSLEQLTKLYNKAIEGDTKVKVGELSKIPLPKERLSKVDANMVKQYISDLRGWSTGFDTAVESTLKIMTEGINKLIPKHRYENITIDKAGNIISKKPGYFETKNILDKLLDYELQLTYTGAMGYRPVTVIRNTFQSMLTLPILGPTYYLKGVSKALTKEGRAEARAAGIIMDDYMPVGGDVTLTRGVVSKTAKVGLSGFKMADSFNRTVAYHGMKGKVEAHVKVLEKDIKRGMKQDKAVKKFIENTDIEFLHPEIIRNEVVPLLQSGKFRDLAIRMGKHLSEETQWKYRKANTPYWMQGKMGRLGGQFGTWPTWYIQYVKNLATRGSKKNIAKRLTTITAQGILIEQIGERVFGVDIKKWVLWHPLAYSGSPMIQGLSAANTLATSKSEYDKSVALNTLESWGKLHVPGYLAINGLIRSLEEEKEEDAIKRVLGFTPKD